MTRISKHALTDTEITCGVTLDQVAEILPKTLVRGTGEDAFVVLPDDDSISPALATSVARCALSTPAGYVGHNTFGQPVYRPRFI